MTILRSLPGLLAGSALLLGAASAEALPQYRLEQTLKLAGDGGWDYLTFEPGSQRLFIARGTRVEVVDTQRLERVGEISDTPGVHGIALAPELGRGYISAGGTSTIVVFDLKTLARIKDIKSTGETPDSIVYEPATQRVFAFNGRGHNATVIDAVSNEVAGTIALDAKPEEARADGAGRVYVNFEDKNSLAVIDARTLTVQAVIPLTGCDSPSGLALNAGARQLFAACANHVMVAVDAAGRVLQRADMWQPGWRRLRRGCAPGLCLLRRRHPHRAGPGQQWCPAGGADGSDAARRAHHGPR